MQVKVVMTKGPVSMPRPVRCTPGAPSATADLSSWVFDEQVLA